MSIYCIFQYKLCFNDDDEETFSTSNSNVYKQAMSGQTLTYFLCIDLQYFLSCGRQSIENNVLNDKAGIVTFKARHHGICNICFLNHHKHFVQLYRVMCNKEADRAHCVFGHK